MILHIGDYLVDIFYMPWRSKVHTLITIFLGTTIPSSVQFGLINLQIYVSNTLVSIGVNIGRAVTKMI